MNIHAKCEKSLEILLDKAIAEQEEIAKRILSTITHDNVADKMEGLLDDDVEIDRYQLGVTMIAVRKLLRSILEEDHDLHDD